MLWHFPLPMMNSFNKTEAAIVPMQAVLHWLRNVTFLDYLVEL